MEESSSSRRRRSAGVVTANACTECRKKRSKCDGQTPCLRCAAVKTECVYEIPVRQSKETMRAEIDALQTHRWHSERVFSAIASGPKAQETLNRLRNGDTLEMIAEWLDQAASRGLGSSQNVTTFPSPATNLAFGITLRMAESVGSYMGYGGSEASDGISVQQAVSPWQSENHFPQSTPVYNQGEESMNWTAESRHQSDSEEPPNLRRPLVGIWSQRPTDNSTQSARGRGQQQVLGPAYREQDPHPSKPRYLGGTWTDVTQDIHLVDHLMTLYFCWEYPTFASLSKEHFLSDFRAGRPRYCSSLLVNAMLALSCRFSDLPESRADPHNPATSGDHFFAEAKRLLAEDDRTSLTTIQAIGLIAIGEASYGHDSESFFYAGQAIRLAVEKGLHLEVTENIAPSSFEEDEGVRAATFWGVFALDQAWCLNTGRIPHFTRTAKLMAKPSIIDEVESSEWVPYTDEGAPDIKSANQPSNVRSVYKCFCELAELVHQSLYTLYVPGRRLTTSEVLAVYTRFLNWYSSLPEALRLGHNFTPAVLFAHMYYHFAILLLFRPFIRLRFIGSRVSPHDVCSQAADAIITLVRSYDQLYTLQHTPSFVPYIVMASCIMQLVRLGPRSASTSTSTSHSPTISSPTNPGLSAFRQGIQDLKAMTDCHGFAERALNVLRFLAEQWQCGEALSEDRLPLEDVQRRCAPSTTSLNFFCPNMGDFMPHVWPARSSVLFAPFPMQGLPLLAEEPDMERDGFSRVF